MIPEEAYLQNMYLARGIPSQDIIKEISKNINWYIARNPDDKGILDLYVNLLNLEEKISDTEYKITLSMIFSLPFMTFIAADPLVGSLTILITISYLHRQIKERKKYIQMMGKTIDEINKRIEDFRKEYYKKLPNFEKRLDEVVLSS